MTRIIAGSARGRRLVVPQHGTRPTSDRVRESMFSTLTSELLASGSDWSDLDVLDLYAGSGALGIEALSRGAASCTFVESAPAALRALRANPTLQVITVTPESYRPVPETELTVFEGFLPAQLPDGGVIIVNPPFDGQ